MAYKLEHIPSDHMAVLVEMMHKLGKSQPDMYIISEEGRKIFTHKMLVGFYSPILGSILSTEYNQDMHGISLPASSNSIVNLLKVMLTGIAISNNKDDLLAVSEVAEAINAKIDNWQVGVKKCGKVKDMQNGDGASKKSLEENVTKTTVKQQDVGFKEKGFFCLYCGKRFRRKDRLKSHYKTHSGVIYPCEICESSFKRRQGLKLHMSKVHDTVLTDEKDNQASVKVKVENNSEIDTVIEDEDWESRRETNIWFAKAVDEYGNRIVGIPEYQGACQIEGDMMEEDKDNLMKECELKYSCKQCEKVFKMPHHLRRHESVHMDIRFSCDACQSSFTRKDKLIAHIRKKHSQLSSSSDVTVSNMIVDNEDKGLIEKFDDGKEVGSIPSFDISNAVTNPEPEMEKPNNEKVVGEIS